MTLLTLPCVQFVDLPKSATLRIDSAQLLSARRLNGIKNIFVGVHCITYTPETGAGVIDALWLSFERAGLCKLIWSNQDERLLAENSDFLMEITEEQAVEIASFHQYSADPANTHAVWPALTSKINRATLSRIFNTVDDSEICNSGWSCSSTTDSRAETHSFVPNSAIPAERPFNFLKFDIRKSFRLGASGRELTNQALDKSWLLKSMIDDQCGGHSDQLLAELQFCFVSVLLLENFACLEQWKRLVQLISFCSEYQTENTKFFCSYIDILREQLAASPRRLYDDFLCDSEFVTEAFKALLKRFDRLNDEVKPVALKIKLSEMTDFLANSFGARDIGSVIGNSGANSNDHNNEDDDLAYSFGADNTDIGYKREDDDNNSIGDPDLETGEYAPTLCYVDEQMQGGDTQ